MGDFVHRVTKQHLISTSPNDLPEPIGKYISNPDLSAVTGFPNIYWIITGDVISLMSQAQRDAVDLAQRKASRDSVVKELDRVESLLRAHTLAVLDEINELRDKHGLPARTAAQFKTAVRGKLGI